jgi:hypothetical protein
MLAASHCTYCSVPLHPQSLINQPRGIVASEVYHMVITITIRLKRMARRVEDSMGKYTGVGSITAREKCVQN